MEATCLKVRNLWAEIYTENLKICLKASISRRIDKTEEQISELKDKLLENTRRIKNKRD
jgi:hypothetical protein